MNHARLLTGLIALTLASGASAAELEYGVDVGIGTSDNIARVPANAAESETIATAGVDFRLQREGSLVNADVDLDLSYFDYRDDTFDSEVTGMAQANVLLAFIPNRFEWVLQDSFGQTELSPFAAATPANRENINYFTTGPNFRMRLGSAGVLTVFGRYSMTDFEDTPLDDERMTGGITLARELSARSSLSFNAVSERIEFDNSLFGSNFDRQSAYLRYDIEGARTRIGAEAGYTELHDQGVTSSSPLLELDIARDISERSTVTLRGSVRSSDAASALRADNVIGGGVPGQQGQVSTADPFETRNVTLAWQFDTTRTGVTLSAGYEKDVYENLSLLDRSRDVYQASAYRQITPRIRLTALASRFANDYGSAGFEDEETHLGLRLSWNVGGHLFVEIDLDDFSHDSSNPLVSFDETRAFLRLAWRSSGGSAGQR